MAVRKLNPVTPGQRHKVAITFDQLTTDRPEKSLLGPKSKTGGRNNTGKMTMRYIGGGHKQRYRIIDSNATRIMFRLVLQRSSTIPIVRRELLY